MDDCHFTVRLQAVFVRNANFFGSIVCDVRSIIPYLEILKRAFTIEFVGAILAVKF